MTAKKFLSPVFYLLLFIILSVTLYLIYYFKGIPDRQLLTFVIGTFLYFAWGIFYHLLKGDFHPKVVIEYLLIAFIAVLLFKGAILH